MKDIEFITFLWIDMEANGVDIATAIYNLTIKIH